MAPRAVLFDFNGTLSQDEPFLCEIYVELFAEAGRPMSAQEYFDHLAGLSDPEIVETWLGHDFPEAEAFIAERIRRYQAGVADGSSVTEATRDAVRLAAARVPVGVVSGAAREEIEPVVRAAGLAECFAFVVAAEDVEHGKPDPAQYLLALELLGNGIRAADVIVYEDTEAGVTAAKAAGMRVFAVLGTLAPERLARADALVETLDADAVSRALAAE